MAASSIVQRLEAGPRLLTKSRRDRLGVVLQVGIARNGTHEGDWQWDSEIRDAQKCAPKGVSS